MPDQHTTSLKGLRIYEDDELILDGDDPTTYTICHTLGDLRRVLGIDGPAEKEPR